MLVKYISTPNASPQQVITDFAKIASGTAISALSASCDKVNSAVLFDTIAPGWTLVDTAGPTNGLTLPSTVISAPDAAGTYTKYVALSASATNQLGAFSFDTYNPVTHTGTNMSSSVVTTGASQIATTAVNTFFIYATSRSFLVIPIDANFCGTIEFTRDASYLSNTSYPSHVVTKDVSLCNMANEFNYISKIRNMSLASGDLTTTNAKIYTCGVGLTASNVGFTGLPPSVYYDGSNTTQHAIIPLYAGTIQSNGSIPLGKFIDIYGTTSPYGNHLDIINTDMNSYLIIKQGTNINFAVLLG